MLTKLLALVLGGSIFAGLMAAAPTFTLGKAAAVAASPVGKKVVRYVAKKAVKRAAKRVISRTLTPKDD